MGLFDDLFSGFFDLNKDGHTDVGEEFMGYMFLSELEKERRKHQLQQQGLPVDEDDLF